jgi:uncharacterized protein YndB with AHSA1/START domain
VKKTRNIQQTVTFDAKPKRVFKALLNSAKHTAFTGEPARIDRKPGGAFACYGKYIQGITLELEPNKRIVQAWRSRNWPKGTYSIVTFTFSRRAGGKTELRFLQIGVPADDYAEKCKGWRTHYWEPLRRFLQAE